MVLLQLVINAQEIKMKYYIIYLMDGKVMEITSWDDEARRDQEFDNELIKLAEWHCGSDWPVNEVQKLNQVC